MLQIHRPLCPNLTLRLTQISPDREDKSFTSFINNPSKGVVLFNQSVGSTKFRDVDENALVDRMVHRGIGLLENSERVELKKHGPASQFERAHLSHIITSLCGGSANQLTPKISDTLVDDSDDDYSNPTSTMHTPDTGHIDVMQKSLADELEEVQPLNVDTHNVFLPSSREPKNLPHYARYLKNQENKYIDDENGHVCYHDNKTGVCKTCHGGDESNEDECHFCDSKSDCDCRAKVIKNVISGCTDINNSGVKQVEENDTCLHVEYENMKNSDVHRRSMHKYTDGHLSSYNCEENTSRLNHVTMSENYMTYDRGGDNMFGSIDSKDYIPQSHSFSPRHKASSSMNSPLLLDDGRSCVTTIYLDLEVTHRGMHRFIPRHSNEIAIETGDPLHVKVEADDLWCEGINLRTGNEGIFPSMYATNLNFLEEDDNDQDDVRKFNLRFLGSVEVNCHKGDDVLCQAIVKVALRHRMSNQPGLPPLCLLEVNEYGLRMIDKSKSGHESDTFSHFFALKNISFCGHHPRNQRYFAFITKHPTYQRFACHVLMGERSTKAVSDAVGWAFHRFYQEYMAFTHQTEDIYIE